MASNIYGTDRYVRKVGTASAAIVAGDLIKRTSTKWVACGNNETAGATAVAVTAASGDTVEFVYSDQNGIQLVLSGAIGTTAVGALAYLSGAQAVDAGSAGDIALGTVDKSYDATHVVVSCQFTGAKTTHA